MRIQHPATAAAAAALLALSLAACGDRKDTAATTTTTTTTSTAPMPAPATTTTTASAPADSAAGAMANVAGDAAITTKVNAAFANDSELSAIKIDVDTKNGAVTLTGPAPSAAAKERATTMARAINGVTSVTNNLVVKAG